MTNSWQWTKSCIYLFCYLFFLNVHIVHAAILKGHSKVISTLNCNNRPYSDLLIHNKGYLYLVWYVHIWTVPKLYT